MKRLLPILLVLAVSPAALADDQFSLAAGFDYSTGKYGNAVSTDILYVPVVGRYESDRLTLKLTVPYISVSGPGGVIQGFGKIASPTGTMGPGMPRFGRSATGGTTTNSGLGDIVASAGYNVYSADALLLDVVGKIKFGTADADKGLGTGENDYSAQVDGYYTLHQKTTLFATAGYKVVGAPTGITVNNVPYGVLGASQKLDDDTDAGVMLSAAKSVTATAGNQQDVTVYASKKLTQTLKLQANVLKGISNGSPDYGAGAMITGYF